MKTVKQFSIPFTGLKPGKHDFEYEITDAFFNEFEYSLVKSGNIHLLLEFDKQQEMMFILHFHFTGKVKLVCERCLDEYIYTLDSREKLIVRTGEEEFDDPEIMTITRHAYEIDISNLIYEYINLALPLIHQHPIDENGDPICSNDTAEVLKKLSGVYSDHLSDNTSAQMNFNDESQFNNEAISKEFFDHAGLPATSHSSNTPGNDDLTNQDDPIEPVDPRWAALKNLKNK